MTEEEQQESPPEGEAGDAADVAAGAEPAPERRSMPFGRSLWLLAALVVAGFFAWSWPLAGSLSTHTIVRGAPSSAGLTSGPGWDLILENDQNLSLWGAAENARALLGLRWTSMLEQGQCYPMPRSTVLGEHMFELGVTAAPWWAVTLDPVFSYNLSLLTSLLLGALGMFLFLRRQTGSVAAATAGAIAFAFTTPRLEDLSYHPAVVGTHWIPWVLWSVDRILDGVGRAATLGLAATLLLACLVGAYPLLAMAMVGTAYFVVEVLRRYRNGTLDPEALAWCIGACVPALVVASYVLLEYARVQQAWALPSASDNRLLVSPLDLLPGGVLSPGPLALAGLVFVLAFRAGPGAAAVPGLVAAAVATFALVAEVPVGGGQGWSLYQVLAGKFALLDSVRAPGRAGLGLTFALQALGAIGWSRAFAQIPARAGVLAALVWMAVVALEARPPEWLRPVLGDGAYVVLREVAPPREHIDAMRKALDTRFERRPVLDLPAGRMVRAPLALLDAAYHGRPTSACYNTLVPPTVRAVDALAERRHRPEGVRELAAAGFGFVIERALSEQRPPDATAYAAPAKLVVFEPGFAIWRLPYPKQIHSDPRRLELVVAGGLSRPPVSTTDPEHSIDVAVTNRGEQMWVPRRPLSPLFGDVELTPADGGRPFRTRARGVFPLALSPGATTTMKLELDDAPDAGAWTPRLRIPGLADVVAGEAGFEWVDERP